MEISRSNSTQNLLLEKDDIEQQDAKKSAQNGRWSESPKTIIVFCTFGFMVCFSPGVVLTAAEDILAKDLSQQTGVVLVAYNIPFVVFTTFIAWSFDRVSTVVFIVSFFPMMLIGMALLTLAEVTWLKFVAVFLIGTVDCTAEIVAMALTAYFDKITIMAFGIGSGVSYVLSPLYYTAMTSWFQISPKIVLMTLVIQPVGFLWGYTLLEERRDKIRSECYHSTDTKTLKNADFLSLKSKLRHCCRLMPIMIQIFLTFMFSSVVVSGVTTSIVFENSPFSPADHYKYYMMSSWGGLCFGRALLGLVELIKPGWADKILIRRTWLLVALTMCHTIILVLASIYRFLPNVWVTMILVFSCGFWTEAVFTNISVILGEIDDYRVRELSLGMSVYGISLGSLAGSVVAKFIEKPLVMHCMNTLKNIRLCLTRKV